MSTMRIKPVVHLKSWQFKQLETLVGPAEGPNNTVVVIPFDAIKPGGMQDIVDQQRKQLIDSQSNETKRLIMDKELKILIVAIVGFVLLYLWANTQ